jgi:hypothetical protein
MEEWKRHCILNHMSSINTDDVKVDITTPTSPIVSVLPRTRPKTPERPRKRVRRRLSKQRNAYADCLPEGSPVLLYTKKKRGITEEPSSDDNKGDEDEDEDEDEGKDASGHEKECEIDENRYCPMCRHDSWEGAQCNCLQFHDDMEESSTNLFSSYIS